MTDATIYHNPACSTSRKALDALRAVDIDPVVIEYLKTPPDRDTLRDLIARAGLTPRQALRTKQSLYTELGLNDPSVDAEDILDAMLEHPVLIERPFVVTALGVRLCRPVERLNEILPEGHP